MLGTLSLQLRHFPCLQAVSTGCAAPSPPLAVWMLWASMPEDMRAIIHPAPERRLRLLAP